ncbi:MAG TPA: ribosome-associated translation inhibitor RaiA [Paracoccaceae bacterium]|nr:ribosome-associated translation inhibitor RaiA [Paracoccaceae bacterium]
MDIRVSGHQLDVGAALTTHAESRLGEMAEKFSVGVTGATATLSPGPHEHEFDCGIVLQLSQGLVMRSNAHAYSDARTAFDGAADKIEKQLRRYKRKLTDRERRGANGAIMESTYRVLQREADEEEEVAEDSAPLIIADMPDHIPEVSVSDAVMLLDLRHTPALMFRNGQTGAFNMVYRREDGHVGWVEPGK